MTPFVRQSLFHDFMVTGATKRVAALVANSIKKMIEFGQLYKNL